MAMTSGGSVPNAGSPGSNYPAPTPHAAVVAHQVYEAPTSGAGIGAGVDGADTGEKPSGSAGKAIDALADSDPKAGNARMGGGSACAIEAPVMGDDSDVVFGAEYNPNTGLGGGTVKALDEMMGLQPGTGYGSVNEPVATEAKGLNPDATGYGSATGTGNQGTGIDRRVVGGEAKTNGGWKSL